MAAHRYWRIYIHEKSGAATFSAIAELELRTSIGGADVTGSGTASANSVTGGAAANAVDNNTGTIWGTSTGAVPHWWAYDFGSGQDKDIVELSITSRSSSAGSAPGRFELQYSDDNTNWSTQLFCHVDTSWPISTTYVFNKDGSDQYWRVYVTAVGSGDDTAIAELEMFTVSGGADQCTGGTASTSNAGTPAANAFNDNPADAWESGAPNALPEWIGYDFGSTKSIVEISITAPAASAASLTPTTFSVQQSPNGLSWTTFWTNTVGSGWANGEKRYYDASGLVVHGSSSVRPVVFVCT
jgi:hypothetical protein